MGMEDGSMSMLRQRSWVVLIGIALVAAACGGETTDGGGGTTGPAAGGTVCATNDTTGDLLAEICDRGEIKVATDPAYPPQSSFNVETGEYEGFDIDVATEIAKRLGVDIAWEEPKWNAIIAGNWQGRWDLSVGSMTVTEERAQVLHFTPAYYYTPASIAVPADSPITSVEELNGATIGVCAGCTYDFFLQGTLNIPGYTFENPIQSPTIKGYDTDSTAIQAVLSGQADAVMSATPTLQAAIDKGREIKIVGDPLFYEPLSIAIDKSSELDPTSLLEAVSGIVEEMHADGTLTDFSMKWYGTDLTKST
jgi:polar amino acid transport system substrate-binding protein